MMINGKGKKVVIVGAARQGLALAGYYVKQGSEVVITDLKKQIDLHEDASLRDEPQVEWVLGGHPLSLLEGADLMSVSGGVPLTIPLVEAARERGVHLTNDSQVFLELVPCPTIGITGSAGKTTTTLLVGKMAQSSLGEEHTWIGGNIGNPLIRVIDQIQENDLVVMELSSFQLELMTAAPEIACVLNITPNHLDRHGNMEAYTAAKARIINQQSPDDTAVLNRDDPGSWALRKSVSGSLVTFGIEKPQGNLPGTYLQGEQIAFWDGESSRMLFEVSRIHLRGSHNLENVLAACAVGLAAGFADQDLAAGVEDLKGVEHRLEFVRQWGGADWYNDSIATAPERSIAALKSFSEPIVLLAGGRDKDLPWQEFIQEVKTRVRHLVVFGEAGSMIRDQARLAESEPGDVPPVSQAATLEQAVQTAADIVQPGDVVLLSPGGTSFDEFEDFTERGDRYKEWVHELS